MRWTLFDWSKIGWTSVAVVLAGLVLVPLGAIIHLALDSSSFTSLFNLPVLKQTLTTLGLMLGVGVGTLVLGASTAWLVCAYRFRGRGLLAALLVLPLAMPAYISAYTYVEMFSFAGPVQSALREWFSWQRPTDYYFPDLHSLGGAIFILSTALYPYIYVAALSIFLSPSSPLLRAGRMLGLNGTGNFLRLVLPIARPTLFAVLMLVFMECLNDLGVVEYLGVSTLTQGLYDVWINRGNLSGGVQIALWMTGFALILIVLERLARANQRWTGRQSVASTTPNRKLSGKQEKIAIAVCLLPSLLGFFIPMIFLANLALDHAAGGAALDLFKLWIYARHSLALAIGAAVLIVAGGLLLAYASRLSANPALYYFSQTAVMGYALPGVVLGLGIILTLTQAELALSTALLTGYKVLLFAYFVRFLAVPFSVIGAGLSAMAPNLDFAARGLGLRASEVFGRIHLPLLRPALWGSLIFVFVEVMRELPLTLITRSFNFDTLATHIYGLASLGLLEEVALPAFFLGLIGLLPAFIWFRGATSTLPSVEATPGIEPR